MFDNISLPGAVAIAILVVLVLVCTVAYLVNGNRSIYTAQQLEC